MDNNHTGPIATAVTGAALILTGIAARLTRRDNAATRAPFNARAVARLVWDLIAGLAQLLVCAAYAFAPRISGPRPQFKTRRGVGPAKPSQTRRSPR